MLQCSARLQQPHDLGAPLLQFVLLPIPLDDASLRALDFAVQMRAPVLNDGAMEPLDCFDPAAGQVRQHDAGLAVHFRQIPGFRRVLNRQRRLQLPNQIVVDDVLHVQILDSPGEAAGFALQFSILRHDTKVVELRAQAVGPVLGNGQSGTQLGRVAEISPKLARARNLAKLPRRLLPLPQLLKTTGNSPVETDEVANRYLPIPQLLHRRMLHRILEAPALLAPGREGEQRAERRPKPLGVLVVVQRQSEPARAEDTFPLFVRELPVSRRHRRLRPVLKQWQASIRRLRPIADVARNENSARGVAAPRDRTGRSTDIQGRAEGPVPQGIRLENARRLGVRAAQEVDQLHEAGLTGAVAGLPVACALTLVREDDVESGTERQLLERLAVAAHFPDHDTALRIRPRSNSMARMM